MKKTKAIGLTVVLLLVLVALPVAVLLLAPATYAGLIERVVSDSTGLSVTFQPLELDLFPPRIEIAELRLSNPDSPVNKPLLLVSRLSAHIDPDRWWQDVSTGWHVNANDVELRLGRDARELNVWQVGAVRPSRDIGTEGATGWTDDDDQIRTALRAFESVKIDHLDVYRLTAQETYRLQVSQLALTHDADETINVAISGSFEQQPLEVSGKLMLATARRPQQLTLSADVFGTELSLKSTVEDDSLLPSEADFRLRADDLSSLSLLLGEDYEALAPIALDGHIGTPSAARWELSAEGELGGLPLQVSTALESNASGYQIGDTTMSYGESAIHGHGTLDLEGRSVTARVSGAGLFLDPLLSLAGEQAEADETTAAPPWDALADWSVDLDVDLDHVSYQQYEARQLAVSLTGGNDVALSIKGELQEVVVTGQGPEQAGGDAEADSGLEIPGPLEFSGKLQLQADGNGNRPVSAHISSPGLEADLEAVLPEQGGVPRRGQIHARLESFDSISTIDSEDSNLASLLPLELSVSAASEASVLKLDQVDMRVSDSQVSGDLVIDSSVEPPHISGSLHSPRIDINRFRMTPTVDEMTEGEAQQGTDDVIDDAPIDWDWLQAARGELDITLDDLLFNQTHFRNVVLRANLEDGQLALDPMRADLSEGGIRGHVRIEKQDAAAHIDTRLTVTRLAPADLGMKDAGLIDGGHTDILLNLDGLGASPQALANSLNGEIAIEVQRATIRNSLLEIIGSDLLLETIAMINPLMERSDTSELECAAAYFTVTDGLMRSPGQLVMETGKMKIRGGGEINLREETLRIDLTPKARKGLGVSLGTLASVVRLGGTLANPKPEADPSGILKSGASIGAAITTGGLSLLAQGLFDRMRSAGGTACGKIFEELPDTEIPEAIEVNETS